MRITVCVPDSVYRRLKSYAASEGSSAEDMVFRGVKQVLKERRRKYHRRIR